MELGWIDFSKSERSKILSVLNLLSENGTLDELGIAPIRDGYANLFFPGTSTIQTRAKYFFVVPYALKDLERTSESNPGRIAASLDAIERSCGEQFLRINKSELGIIGNRSLSNGQWVKRTPADIYWAGLRQYGIFQGGTLSLSEYIKTSCALKNQKATLQRLGNRNDSSEESDMDDKNAGDLFKMHFWKCPTYTTDWKDTLSMPLTPEESAFLKEQIIMTCQGSMLAYILENDMRNILDICTFQELETVINVFPKDMQQDYKLALSFSDFIYVVRTVYNVMISDGNNMMAVQELERLTPDMTYFADIDLKQILDKLKIISNPLLNKFLLQVQEAMRSGDINAMQKYIKNREIQLKGTNRAKTTHPGEFDPSIWVGGYGLDYRFSNAKAIMKDIFDAGGERHA